MTLRKDIERAINQASAENNSNTPDFILAGYLTACLAAYEEATNERDRWWQEAVSYEEANRRSEAYRQSREMQMYHAAPPDGGTLDSDGDRIRPWDRFYENLNYEKWEAGYYPEHITIEKLLAEYYGIDLDVYFREQKAMLDEIKAI